MDTYSDEELTKQYEAGRIGFDEKIIEQINIKENSTILEIGCGNGRFLKKLHELNKNLKLEGIDYSTAGIEHCRRTVPGTFYNTDFRKIDIVEKYDYVLCFQTLEHLEDTEFLINKIKNLCKDDGIVVITVPNKELDKCEDHIWFWNKDEFLNLYGKLFSSATCETFDSNQNLIFKAKP